MWASLRLGLQLESPTVVERAESFVQWMIHRASIVNSVSIVARRADVLAAEAGASRSNEALAHANLIAALVIAGPSLRELSLDWTGSLVLSAWMASLTSLRVASLSAQALTVRHGLHSLSRLQDVRFRSSAMPLVLAGHDVLPLGLSTLRLDGCNLRELPLAVARLPRLTDLVLSNNNFGTADLDALSTMTTLRQLTLMGTRLPRLPEALSALTKLRVLYLDGVAGATQALHGDPTHMQLCDILGPLRRLGILSLGSSHIWELPLELASLTGLRALYLDNNPALESLPDGPYLRRLRVLGIDWKVLFASHTVLLGAPLLRKLCLTSFGGVADGQADGAGYSEEDAVTATLLHHPCLSEVLLPMVDGNQVSLKIQPLNIALRLAHKKGIHVRAVTYAGISNEWIEW